MSRRKGYSIFRRKGSAAWYVAWTDGHGQRQVERASLHKNVASEIGRAKATEADRVRGGVVDASEVRATAAGRESLSEHIEAWAKALKHKGDTLKHVEQQKARVTKLLDGVGTLAGIRADDVTAKLATLESPNTARHYLTALRGFIRWCDDTDRIIRSPIKGVKMPQVSGERFRRMSLSDAQVFAIMHAAVTRKSKSTTIPGIRRSKLYLIMAYTGLRVSEARSLTPESFDWKNQTVTVEAGYSKRRRRDTQQFGDEVWAIVRPWAQQQPEGRKLFPFGAHANLHRIFKADCEAAGVKPAKGERLGMHSLRRWAITNMDKAEGLVVAQKFARHSTPTLTAKYRDVTSEDIGRGLTKLPKPLVAPLAAQGEK